MAGRVRVSALAPVVLIASLATSSCTLGQEADSRSAAATEADGAGMIQRFEMSDREVVDDFSGKLLDGSDFSAGQLDGAVAVVNVWGSWCAPCRTEAPALRQVATDFADEGVAFLGLNVRDNDAAAKAFERRFEIPYPSLTSDDSPAASLAFANMLSTTAVPMTVVLDPQRRIAARVVGEVSEPTLRGLVEDVLAEGAG
jgi:thiol-disulfide isomerase/thioredoxin